MTLALCVAGLAACGGREQAEHHDEEHHGDEGHEQHAPGEEGLVRVDREMLRDLHVTTAVVESRAAGERATVLGELAVNQEAYAEIASPMPARVVRVLVSPGDRVKAGQALVELASPDLGKARAEYVAARARAEQAGRALARKRELEAEKLVPAREVLEAEASAAGADADVRVALAALRAYGGAGDEGGADASRFVLRSPVAGTIIERDVVMGQLAEPSRTLLRAADLSRLWLVAHVFERDALRVRVGGTGSVTFAALPGQTFEASITAVGHEVEPSSRTVPVRLEVPNPDGTLRPGMSATVALPVGDEAGRIVTVPIAAVQRVGEGWAVFLPRPEEGLFEARRIGRGRELGGEVEILSGLTAGETVVIDGAFLLKAEAGKARGEGGGHDHH